MSVTMTGADGVAVSACPPLCQILRGLCYSPVLCSVSQGLRGLQGTSQAVLGALQILTGVFNIGLGTISSFLLFVLSRNVRGSFWYDLSSGYPIWLGILFIFFGFTSIFSGKFPSPCLVMVNVLLNFCGVVFGILGIVLYSINTANNWDVWWSCDYDRYYYSYRQTTTPSPQRDVLTERCLEGNQLFMMIVRSINLSLVVQSVLELCLVISSVTLGIKALKRNAAKKSTEEPETHKSLMEEVTPNLKV